MSSRPMSKGWRFLLVLALVFIPTLVQAQTRTTAPIVLNLAAGQTVKLPVWGFCLNRGLPFPGAQMVATTDTAPDNVRAAIGYALTKGYIPTDSWQVQLAIWHLLDGQHVAEESEIAAEVIAYAQGGALPPDADVTLTTLPAAVQQGLVSARIDDYRNVSPTGYSFIGKGVLVVTNLTQAAVKIHLPYGARFSDEAQTDTQDVGIFADPVEIKAALPETGGFLAPEVGGMLTLLLLALVVWLWRRRVGTGPARRTL